MKAIRILLIVVPFLFACDKNKGESADENTVYQRNPDGTYTVTEKECKDGKCKLKTKIVTSTGEVKK